MSEMIHLRGEGGAVWRMTLPLQQHIRQRYEAGDLVRVNADGSDWTGGKPQRRRRSPAPGEQPEGTAGA